MLNFLQIRVFNFIAIMSIISNALIAADYQEIVPLLNYNAASQQIVNQFDKDLVEKIKAVGTQIRQAWISRMQLTSLNPAVQEIVQFQKKQESNRRRILTEIFDTFFENTRSLLEHIDDSSAKGVLEALAQYINSIFTDLNQILYIYQNRTNTPLSKSLKEDFERKIKSIQDIFENAPSQIRQLVQEKSTELLRFVQ